MAKRVLSFDPVAEAHRQWEAHDWPHADNMAAATSIMRAQQIVLAQVEQTLRPFGLTFARYEALVLLHFTRTGELPLGKMGERLQVHPTSMTNAVDRLEAQGLVERTPHPVDGRAVLARITPAGQELTIRATEALSAHGFSELGLNERELRQLFRLLRKVRRAAGDFVD